MKNPKITVWKLSKKKKKKSDIFPYEQFVFKAAFVP